jgi:peptidoglycan lytic transglycosylase D
VPFKRLFSLTFFAIAACAPMIPCFAGELVALNSPLPATPADLTQQQPASQQSGIKPALTPDTSLQQNDLWQRIRSGFAMPDMDNRMVRHYERWYADRPDYVARMTERARRYLYFIEGEVEKRGMPSEIALLPMIESAFNPTAYSSARASGIWQFIPSTGKHFGLEQNWWHDERRDVISATNSALDYLQKLHDEFGDWELALAAYNWGEKAVEHAQARNRRHHRPVDYQHLRMPRETRNYVPKLLAVRNIINNPQKFGLTLQEIPNQPYFAAVIPPYHMDVKVAAQLADISMDEFLALNPSHNRPVILQNDSTPILLPVNKIETFMTNVDIYDQPLVSWQPYQPKKGERLTRVAARFNIPVEKLRSANGLPSYIKTCSGQKLLVPDSNPDDLKNDFEAFNTNLPPTLDDRHAIVHVVRRGETLGGIARHYHVSTTSLKRRNHNSTLIHPGQRLVVAGGLVPRYRHHRHYGRHHGSHVKVAYSH